MLAKLNQFIKVVAEVICSDPLAVMKSNGLSAPPRPQVLLIMKDNALLSRELQHA